MYQVIHKSNRTYENLYFFQWCHLSKIKILQQKNLEEKPWWKNRNQDPAVEKVAELRGCIKSEDTLAAKVAELGWRGRKQQIPPTIAVWWKGFWHLEYFKKLSKVHWQYHFLKGYRRGKSCRVERLGLFERVKITESTQRQFRYPRRRSCRVAWGGGGEIN